jgi:hypothetical protein
VIIEQPSETLLMLREAAKLAYARISGGKSITSANRTTSIEACLVGVCYKACLECLDGLGQGHAGLRVAVVWRRENGATVIVRYDGAEVEIASPGERN